MITIGDLSYNYGTIKALNSLNLELNNGMIGLLGENGAGKTTLMKLLATLKPIKTGTAKINGIGIVNKNYKKIRKVLGFMPQEFGFYGHFTVYEILEYMCLLENIPQKFIQDKIKSLLEELNLASEIEKRTKALSGGMKRRLGLA